jgi:hypothetical protein
MSFNDSEFKRKAMKDDEFIKKNPIVKAIKKTLKLGKQKLTQEYQICLLPS